MKRMVGVSLRVIEELEYHETRDAISHDWISFLTHYGVIPILIPNVLLNPVTFIRETNISALLLSTGNNVGVLNENIKGRDVSVDRDNTERKIIDFAVNRSMPLLGVCRGMQMLNVHFGGKIVHDLTKLCGASDAHVGILHEVKIPDVSWKGKFETARAVTNSFHRQAVTLSTLSSDLVAFAVADHSIVEGLYHPDLPIIGIQWHPERQNSPSRVDQIIIESWLSRIT